MPSQAIIVSYATSLMPSTDVSSKALLQICPPIPDIKSNASKSWLKPARTSAAVWSGLQPLVATERSM
jgi:hypothetical protein